MGGGLLEWQRLRQSVSEEFEVRMGCRGKEKLGSGSGKGMKL